MWSRANLPGKPGLAQLIDTLKRRWLLISIFLVVFSLTATMMYLLLGIPPMKHLIKHNPHTTAFIEQRKSEGRLPKKFGSLQKTWIPLHRIPDTLQKTVLVAEDGGFYQHNGLDWHEIKQAMHKNIQKGRIVRGASTITQQLAKNLFLSDERTIFRKIREWLLAAKLEKHLSKYRILELYLNCIEYGPKTFGLLKACRRYFNKTPENLKLSEMIRLVAIIPKPLGLDPTKPSRELYQRCRTILDRLLNYRYIDLITHQKTMDSFERFFNSYPHPDREDQKNLIPPSSESPPIPQIQTAHETQDVRIDPAQPQTESSTQAPTDPTRTETVIEPKSDSDIDSTPVPTHSPKPDHTTGRKPPD